MKKTDTAKIADSYMGGNAEIDSVEAAKRIVLSHHINTLDKSNISKIDKLFAWLLVSLNFFIKPSRHMKNLYCGVGVVCLVFLALVVFVLPIKPQPLNSVVLDLNNPLAIQYKQIIKLDDMPTITPNIDGQWNHKKNVSGSLLEFVPLNSFLSSDTEYKVSIKNVKTLAGVPIPDETYVYKTVKAPEVKTCYPIKDSNDISNKTEIRLQLSAPNKQTRRLRATIDPAVDLEYIGSKDDISFTWKPKTALSQGQQYTVFYYDDNYWSKEPIYKSTFVVSGAVTVTNDTKKDHLNPDDTINIIFSKPMDITQGDVIKGQPGKGKWENSTTYKFKLAQIAYGQQYDFVVAQGLRATDESYTAKDETFSTQAMGNVYVAIENLGSNVELQKNISVSFDVPVQKPTAEARFNIEPKVNGSINWVSDRRMIFTPEAYEAQVKYTVRMAEGVAPVGYGLPSRAVAASFVTKPPTKRLAVPLYRQQHRSSCEAAATKMALAYKGVNVDEMTILNAFGYNPRHIDTATNSWDDPNDMYVGDVDGNQGKLEGYGAYARPIAKGANALGRTAEAYYGVSAQFIAQQIYNDNPVVIIGTMGTPKRVTWNGPNGVVEAWYGEHARTVVGVVGKLSDPIGFYVNDPLVSNPLYWSRDKLLDDINAIPQVPSQVVVVH